MFKMNLQLFAHKKGVGSTRTDVILSPTASEAKRADGQFVLAGNYTFTDSAEQRFTRVST